MVSRSAAMALRSAPRCRSAVVGEPGDLPSSVMPSSPSFSARIKGAMDDEIGVAADGRGEVRVRRRLRPKWPMFSGCTPPAPASAGSLR